MTASRRTTTPLAAAVLVALTVVLAACGAAGGPSPSPTMAGPTPTPVPGASGNLGGGAIGGGGNVGGGIQPPCCKGGPGDPNLGQAALVVPQPGQLDIRPVSVALIRAVVDGHHVTVELRWWSGVAPCSVLDSVDVARDGSTFTLTPMEGASQRDVACDLVAQLKATIVDLGDLDPGTYTIKAAGDPPPVEATVSR